MRNVIRQEVLEAAVQQRRQPDTAAGEEVRTPDERLAAEDPLEPRSLAKPARERVPGAGKRAGQGSPERHRDEEREPPSCRQQHRLCQVDDRAVGGKPHGSLDQDEAQREAHEQPVAASPPLEQVDDDGRRCGGADPDREPAQAQAEIERAEREEPLAQKAGQAGQQDAQEGRLRQAVGIRLR